MQVKGNNTYVADGGSGLKTGKTAEELAKEKAENNIAKLQEYYGKQYETGKNKVNANYDAIQGTIDSGKQYVNDSYAKGSSALLERYNTGVGTLAQNRDTALQEAAINNEKLLKYLPEHLKRQGLHNLGVSETAYIQANNDYMNNRGRINSDYQEGSSELLQKYQDSQLQLDQSRDDKLFQYSQKEAENETARGQAISELEQKYGEDMFFSERDENGNLIVDMVDENFYKTNQAQIDAMTEEFYLGLDEYRINKKLTEGAKQKAISDLEKIKGSIGTYAYNQILARINSETALTEAELTSDFDTKLAAINANTDSQTKLAQLEEMFQDLDLIRESDPALYNALSEKLGVVTDKKNYSVSGKAKSTKLTVNGTTYNLRGTEVTDETGFLNRITTGDANSTPKDTVIVVGGSMYRCKDGTWYELKDGDNNPKMAIATFKDQDLNITYRYGDPETYYATGGKQGEDRLLDLNRLATQTEYDARKDLKEVYSTYEEYVHDYAKKDLTDKGKLLSEADFNNHYTLKTHYGNYGAYVNSIISYFLDEYKN